MTTHTVTSSTTRELKTRLHIYPLQCDSLQLRKEEEPKRLCEAACPFALKLCTKADTNEDFSLVMCRIVICCDFNSRRRRKGHVRLHIDRYALTLCTRQCTHKMNISLVTCCKVICCDFNNRRRRKGLARLHVDPFALRLAFADWHSLPARSKSVHSTRQLTPFESTFHDPLVIIK